MFDLNYTVVIFTQYAAKQSRAPSTQNSEFILMLMGLAAVTELEQWQKKRSKKKKTKQDVISLFLQNCFLMRPQPPSSEMLNYKTPSSVPPKRSVTLTVDCASQPQHVCHTQSGEAHSRAGVMCWERNLTAGLCQFSLAEPNAVGKTETIEAEREKKKTSACVLPAVAFAVSSLQRATHL